MGTEGMLAYNKCFLLESPCGLPKRLFTLAGREGTASHAPEMKPVQGSEGKGTSTEASQMDQLC